MKELDGRVLRKSMGEQLLYFPYQIQARLKRIVARVPVGGTYFIAVVVDKFRRLEFPQKLFGIAADAVGVHFIGLENAIGVDDKTSSQGIPLIFKVDAKRVGKRVGSVRRHRKLDFLYARRSIPPCLVYMNAVGRNAHHFRPLVEETVVMVRHIFKLRGAYKRKVRRIEKEDEPATLEIAETHLYIIVFVVYVKGDIRYRLAYPYCIGVPTAVADACFSFCHSVY